MMRSTIAVAGAVLVAACATGGHPRSRPGVDTTVTGHSYEEIWTAAVKAAEARSDVVDNNKNLGIIQAERRSGPGSSGSSLRILISPPLAGAEAYRVEVVAGATGRAGREWERQVIRHFRDLLEGG